LRSSLQKMPRVQTLLRKETSVATLQELAESLPDLSECSALLESALQEHPASTLKEGGVIRPGFDRDLDTLRSLSQNSKQHLGELLTKERSRTGIGSLKIEYNSVFGYYIEITKTHLEKVPMDYERKQTLVNAERFITPELKILEAKILRAEEQAIRLESELFDRVRQTCARFLQPLLRAADLVAELDVYLALATTALRNHYVRPQMHDGFTFSIKEGRHPVVENMAGAYFVPNDTYLENDENQLLMITGPNMAGKSTYLRQNALIPIMAQMGGFVPAKQADLCIVDKVFTRVGAADHLALGQSTFMVEMSETAHILRSATPRSLIILDEVGRGTSTFDGVSIAWAIAEHIHDRIGAKTLFATHYFELTELSLTKPKIKNYTVLVKEQNETIQFLRKILPGQTDRSYGIQVARLAGLPQTILNRAKEILHNLENANYTEDGKSRLAFHEEKPEPGALPQKSLYPENLEKQGEIVTELLAMDLDRTNGMEALQWLHRWRERLSTRD
jgi:DNA mismatch repair protein MutS